MNGDHRTNLQNTCANTNQRKKTNFYHFITFYVKGKVSQENSYTKDRNTLMLSIFDFFIFYIFFMFWLFGVSTLVVRQSGYEFCPEGLNTNKMQLAVSRIFITVYPVCYRQDMTTVCGSPQVTLTLGLHFFKSCLYM